MKRALAEAPLGPKATLALTHAILCLEEDLAGPVDGPGRRRPGEREAAPPSPDLATSRDARA